MKEFSSERIYTKRTKFLSKNYSNIKLGNEAMDIRF